jgi:TatD DNase family protein
VAGLIDTHCHLDDEQFASDLPAVIERARAAGLEAMVAVATSAPSSHTCLDLSRCHPGIVFPSAGIHPNHITQAAPNAWDEIVSLATNEAVVGIGETGLDRHWDDTPFPQQEDYFARHLALSRQTRKPIIIHCREAEADVVRMLRDDFDRHGPIRGIMHSFTGSAATAAACLEMGLYLSFAGMLTYKNAAALREVAATVPPERVLVETDSPYLSPVPLRGKRNEPGNVVHTAACLAGLLGLDEARLAEQTTRNARAVFTLPVRLRTP